MIFWGLIYLAYICLASLSFVDNGRGAAYPEILKDFSLGADQGAWIFALSAFAGLLANFTSKYWLSWLGPKKSTQISLVFLGISGIGVSHAGESKNFILMLIFCGLLGIGVAVATITMNILIVDATPASSRRRFFSGLHAVYGLSSLVAPMALAYLIAKGQTWMFYFYCAGCFSFVAFISSFFIGRKTSISQIRKIEGNIPRKIKILFGLLFSFYLFSEIIASSMLTLYLQASHNFPAAKSKSYLGIFFFLLMTGRLLMAARHVNTKNEKLLKASLLLTIIFSLFGLFYSPIFLLITGLSMSYFLPVAFDFLAQTFGKKADYMTTSVMAFMEVFVCVMHFLFGHLISLVGIKIAFFAVPIFSFLTFGVLIFIDIVKKNGDSNWV